MIKKISMFAGFGRAFKQSMTFSNEESTGKIPAFDLGRSE
jgi:hypothetical protein